MRTSETQGGSCAAPWHTRALLAALDGAIAVIAKAGTWFLVRELERHGQPEETEATP